MALTDKPGIYFRCDAETPAGEAAIKAFKRVTMKEHLRQQGLAWRLKAYPRRLWATAKHGHGIAHF